MDSELDTRLTRIEALLVEIASQHVVRDWYSTEEFAAIVGRSEFTVREWCRHGRLSATKKGSGRGPHAA